MMTTTTPAAVINTNELMNVLDLKGIVKDINKAVEAADESAFEDECPEDGIDGDHFDYSGCWDAEADCDAEDGYTYYLYIHGEAEYFMWRSKGERDSYGLPLEPDGCGGGINWVSIDDIDIARIKTGDDGDYEELLITDEVKKELISYIEERVYTGDY